MAIADPKAGPRKAAELRRMPRLSSRCRAWIRDRFGTWDGETEDISPRGCRIVTPRAQTVGALVRLIVSSDRMSEPLVVVGQVVWAVNGHPSRAGVSFAGAPGDGPPASAWVRSLRDAQEAPAIEIVVAPPELVDAPPGELLPRLLERARELAGAGAAGAASVLLERALALAPEDPDALALRRELAGAARAVPAA